MITAIILAAGESRRMGRPKMLLPWKEGTVLSHIISVVANAGLEDILIVTGSEHERIAALIEDWAGRFPVHSIFNPEYASGEMLSSIQCGLRSLTNTSSEAALIGLGDQPQIEERTVRLIREACERTNHDLIVPSYEMRRGHPWLVGRAHWEEILKMRAPQTPREFLIRHGEEIHYVEVENESILADLDTPDDYAKARAE